ncbi:hypothetical protein FOA52_007796 [Chlamydomonas sp. UWO 241]|nr:hypothetical protein FOA52_007796 [Chlamydomonas sp. UWO 241]
MTVAAGPPRALLPDPGKERFRYWIDYQVLSSPKSAALLERALVAAGGRRSGGPPKLDPVTAAKQKCKDYGYMHMDSWEFLWSITAKAMLAAEILRPGQLVGIIPGFLCISRKTSLIRSLRAVHGDETAFSIVPLTFKLPEEMDEWAAWIASHPQQDTGLWMLKNNRQRGTGLRLVKTDEAFDAVFETTTRPGLEGMVLYRWYLAQQYLHDPMLIDGRKFGLRVWVLVPGVNPLRVYVHGNGLLLFSADRYDPAATSCEPGGLPAGHVTNVAQNESGPVLPMSALRERLGPTRFAELWSKVARAVALTFTAALPRVQEVQAQMALPPRSCFQFFGLDFLIDSQMHPWLLEANATPSMKVEHDDPAARRMIHDQKWPVIRDVVQMLGICPQRFDTSRKDHRDLSFMDGELASRGGFSPLMHLFPRETQPEGLGLVEWSRLDKAMRGYCDTRAYREAQVPTWQ